MNLGAFACLLYFDLEGSAVRRSTS